MSQSAIPRAREGRPSDYEAPPGDRLRRAVGLFGIVADDFSAAQETPGDRAASELPRDRGKQGGLLSDLVLPIASADFGGSFPDRRCTRSPERRCQSRVIEIKLHRAAAIQVTEAECRVIRTPMNSTAAASNKPVRLYCMLRSRTRLL